MRGPQCFGVRIRNGSGQDRLIPSQIQNAKTLKINGTLKMKTGIKRASAFWHRFVAILKNKTVVPEALNIERGTTFRENDKFGEFRMFLEL